MSHNICELLYFTLDVSPLLLAASARSATSTLPILIHARYPCNNAMANLAIAIGKQINATVRERMINHVSYLRSANYHLKPKSPSPCMPNPLGLLFSYLY